MRITSSVEIDDYGDGTALDTLRRVGNATAQENGQFTLRGINSTGVDGNEFGRPLATVYVDGVALDRVGLQTGTLDSFDVEQVEVLRGSQSTGQGRNALAGSIVVKTKDPQPFHELNVKAMSASDGYLDAGIVVGGPLTSNLSHRIVFNQKQDDGFVYNRLRDEDSGYFKTRRARAKLAWQASDKLKIVFGASRAENERGSQTAYVGDETGMPRIDAADSEQFYRHQANLFSVNGEWQLGPMSKLVSTTGLQFGDEKTQFDVDGVDLDHGIEYINRAASDSRTITQEFRL